MWFVDSGSPWFLRGAPYDHGNDSGVFVFFLGSSRASESVSFRV